MITITVLNFHSRFHIFCAVSVITCVLSLNFQTLLAQSWIDETYEDFVTGEFDASGQNLFVSHDGKIRTIRRFDLNNDGHLDLVFNNTHNTSTDLEGTLAFIENDKLHHQSIPLQGSEKIVAGDLNNDGFIDLVFSPNYNNVRFSRRFLTVIWGNSDGWPIHRSTSHLPVSGGRGSKGLDIADLNQDGWKDIIALTESELRDVSEILRIYFGSKNGFYRDSYKDIPVDGAIAFVVRDLDSNGTCDLAVLTRNDKLHLLWGNSDNSMDQSFEHHQTIIDLPIGSTSLAAGNLNQGSHKQLAIGTNKGVIHVLSDLKEGGVIKTFEADDTSDLVIADVDGDTIEDIIATNFLQGEALGGEAEGALESGQVKIFWGLVEDGRYNISANNFTKLEVDYPVTVEVEDLTENGYKDVVVAVYQSDTTFAGKSQLFVGQGNRQFNLYPQGIPTSGSTDVAVTPKTFDGSARMIFANSFAGNIGEKIPLQIYWGTNKGFSPVKLTEIPFRSGYESTAADLNGNGYVDLIALNSGHAQIEDNPDEGANIFWGNQDGFSNDKKTILNESRLGTSDVADLNRDGYLDIILGSFKVENDLVIYYGSNEGYQVENRESISLGARSIGNVIADFDRNGWLDIAMVSHETDELLILWGSENGFDNTDIQRFKVPSVMSLETADLNSNGFLDLIVGTFNDRITEEFDTGLRIIWGGEDGFSPSWNMQWLPGMAPIGFTVADFDNDGYLDLFSPHYYTTGRRDNIPSYLYWGSSDGFSPKQKTTLIIDSAHDSMTGDFNGDSMLDIAVAAHFGDGSHYTNSKVFYNDGNRFKDPDITELPTKGTHWMYRKDIGHIYNRKWKLSYKSSIFQWNKKETKGKLKFKADILGNSELQFFIRSAENDKLIDQSSWRNLDDHLFNLNSKDRVLQYKAVFTSDNGDRYPILDQVKIDLN